MGRLHVGDGENQKLHVCTIRHGYVDTLKKLGFGSRSNDISEWMPAARNPSLWAQIVEDRLGLQPGTYMKYKFRQ